MAPRTIKSNDDGLCQSLNVMIVGMNTWRMITGNNKVYMYLELFRFLLQSLSNQIYLHIKALQLIPQLIHMNRPAHWTEAEFAVLAFQRLLRLSLSIDRR